MEEVLKCLNQNSGSIGVLFSGLVTLATLVYAILTWKLVNETRRMRKVQTDAKVVVSLDTRKEAINFIDFILKNEGNGPAYDLKFTAEPVDPENSEASILTGIRSFGFFNKGLDYLSSRQEIRSFLTSMLENFQQKIDTSIRIDVSYKSSFGERFNEKYILDFSIFKGIHQLGKPNLYSIAKSLEKIQTDIHNLTAGSSQVRVLTQTKAEYLEEEQKRLEEAEEFFRKQDKEKSDKTNMIG
jgi:hypothetical protein